MNNCPNSEAEIKHDQDTSWKEGEEAAYIENNNRRITEAVDDVLGSESEEDIDLVMECIVNSPQIRRTLRNMWSVDVPRMLLSREVLGDIKFSDWHAMATSAFDLNLVIAEHMRHVVDTEA